MQTSRLDTPRFSARRTASGDEIHWPGGVVACVFGRSGLIASAEKREGDGATPIAPMPFRHVLFRPDRVARPATALPTAPITEASGWCDDPGHPAYNQAVELPLDTPFPASHERLWREDALYDVIVVLGWNDEPVTPGRGSAIFLHVAADDFTPTEGCVGCTRDDLLRLLAEAKPGDAIVVTTD